jgi:hypothetical protein
MTSNTNPATSTTGVDKSGTEHVNIVIEDEPEPCCTKWIMMRNVLIAVIVLASLVLRILALITEHDKLKECGDFELWIITLIGLILTTVVLICSHASSEKDDLTLRIAVFIGYYVWGVYTIFTASECSHDTISYIMLCVIIAIDCSILATIPFFGCYMYFAMYTSE